MKTARLIQNGSEYSSQTHSRFQLYKSLFTALILAQLFLFETGCGKMSLSVKSQSKVNKLNDFARSEILSSGPGIADGNSDLLVVVQLMNSDASPVVLYKPEYKITKGNGVEARECTTTNDNGVATCILRSRVPGKKTVAVTNVKINLEKDVLFEAPNLPGSMVGVAPGAAYNIKSTSGHQLSGTVGNPMSDTVKVSASGYKLYGGVEGNAFSK